MLIHPPEAMHLVVATRRDPPFTISGMRAKGQMEQCTFCVQRRREGRLPACVEACPTGSRVFGNLLDPKSEIRYVLKHKKVFRFKEDLGTDPKFWYFID